MTFVKILQWAVRIIILVLLIILIIDNMRTTTFNFIGIYQTTLPLIVILLVFLAIGIVVGLIVGMFRKFELKAKINMLEKELKKSQQISAIN